MRLAGRTIAVTGANGFVGAAVVRRLAADGARVVALVRVPRGDEVRWTLGEGLPAGVDEVVHAAWDMSAGASDAANVEGAERVLAGATWGVFVSSMAAHEAARSAYGRSKREVEGRVRGVAVVRPGTVVGEGPRAGLFAATRALVRKLPAVPLFYARGRRFQTVHVETLAEAIVAMAAGRLTGEFNVADADGVAVADFYRAVAALEGKGARLVPFPGDVALGMTRVAEAVGVRLPVTSNNLLGLKYLRRFAVAESAARLGVAGFGTFAESMERIAVAEGDRGVIDRVRACL